LISTQPTPVVDLDRYMADAVVAAEADACEGCAAPSCAASVKPHRTHVVVCVGINFTHEKTPPNIELADHGPLVLCAKIAQAVQDVKGLKVTACSIRSRNAKTFAKRTLGQSHNREKDLRPPRGPSSERAVLREDRWQLALGPTRVPGRRRRSPQAALR